MAEDVSHFSMVGFDLDMSSMDAFNMATVEIADECEFVDFPPPHMLCLIRDDSGAEIWIGAEATENGIAMSTVNPAFNGAGQMPVTITAITSDPAWEPFEYQLSVTFSDMGVPVMIEVADPRELSQLEAGTEVTLDVTGFTYNPEIFENSEAYYAAQPTGEGEVSYTADHFIPSGLFGDTPSAYAVFAGQVLTAELKSGHQGAQYWELLVSTMGDVTITVVFDDASTNAQPKPGNILTGEFWLSGRIAGTE